MENVQNIIQLGYPRYLVKTVVSRHFIQSRFLIPGYRIIGSEMQLRSVNFTWLRLILTSGGLKFEKPARRGCAIWNYAPNFVAPTEICEDSMGLIETF